MQIERSRLEMRRIRVCNEDITDLSSIITRPRSANSSSTEKKITFVHLVAFFSHPFPRPADFTRVQADVN